MENKQIPIVGNPRRLTTLQLFSRVIGSWSAVG